MTIDILLLFFVGESHFGSCEMSGSQFNARGTRGNRFAGRPNNAACVRGGIRGFSSSLGARPSDRAAPPLAEWYFRHSGKPLSVR